MEVFSKSYLDHVVRTQGALFDDFARRYPNCNTDDFITAYLNGSTRAAIDAGQAYVATMNDEELLRWFLDHDACQPRAGESMKGFMPDWIGRFYVYYQWDQKKSSAESLKAVPLDYLKSAYAGLHDLELDLAVRKVAG